MEHFSVILYKRRRYKPSGVYISKLWSFSNTSNFQKHWQWTGAIRPNIITFIIKTCNKRTRTQL